MPEYEAAIGMEVHAELLTGSKMFCGCRNAFGGEPNTRCCPVCTGMPGSLPVMNRRAVEHVIRAALALNCRVSPDARFDRKNYFYPDLPKGFQISQYERPIGIEGWLGIDTEAGPKRVRIRRVHLEEDTGKLLHLATGESAVDFNRSGVPLMEIVTEFPPDMRTAEEARAYLTKLRAVLTYIGVSDGKMEEGSLRCEPNLSVRPVGSAGLGTKTEIKNLNSFRAVYRGIEYETARQIGVLRSGGAVAQETRGWDDARGQTFTQRSKEVEQEYRYFPEPDLVPLQIDEEWVDRIRRAMPELPDAARARFVEQYELPPHAADALTQTRATADFFEEAALTSGDPRAAANWMIGDLARLLNASGTEITDSRVSPRHLADMLALMAEGVISGKMAKGIFEEMFATGVSARALADRAGPQVSDTAAIAAWLEEAIAAEPRVWQELCGGDTRKQGYFVGQVMKASRGKANPAEVNRVLRARMEGA
ncbi:MAG: Asp-tRNA(Asn)/Glu-tRNA(Gln) amidotransferase subunit GatB [Chthonomonadales bacterium]|nr:Asp-tRNA(Asn)/Glu-tRNA(Gln) amidotransferase subunit GatB [Chthonomonadales bacterium]